MASDHLEPEQLADIAVTGEKHPHLSGCETCEEQLTSFQNLVSRLRELPEPPASLAEAATAYYVRRRRLETLIEQLAERPDLRARARLDPAGVLLGAGLEPIDELIELLADEGRDSGDLASRIAARGLWL